jgi:hypothetical protein
VDFCGQGWVQDLASELQKRNNDDKPAEQRFLRGIVIIVGLFLWLTAIISKVLSVLTAAQ